MIFCKRTLIAAALPVLLSLSHSLAYAGVCQISAEQWGNVVYELSSDHSKFEDWQTLQGVESGSADLFLESVSSILSKKKESSFATKIDRISDNIARFALKYEHESGAQCIETCTAVKVSPSVFLTNDHCVSPNGLKYDEDGNPMRADAELRLGYLSRKSADSGIALRARIINLAPELQVFADKAALDFAFVELVSEYEPINATQSESTRTYNVYNLDSKTGERVPYTEKLNWTGSGEPLLISETQPAITTPIAIIGHPLGTQQYVSHNQCQILKIDEDQIVYGVLCKTFSGQSGSPVFDLEKMTLIGLHRQNRNASNIKAIADAIKKYGKSPSLIKIFDNFNGTDRCENQRSRVYSTKEIERRMGEIGSRDFEAAIILPEAKACYSGPGEVSEFPVAPYIKKQEVFFHPGKTEISVRSNASVVDFLTLLGGKDAIREYEFLFLVGGALDGDCIGRFRDLDRLSLGQSRANAFIRFSGKQGIPLKLSEWVSTHPVLDGFIQEKIETRYGETNVFFEPLNRPDDWSEYLEYRKSLRDMGVLFAVPTDLGKLVCGKT